MPHEPTYIHDEHHGDSSLNFFIGIIVLAVLAILFFYYLLPFVRNTASPAIQIPGRVDVNVNSK